MGEVWLAGQLITTLYTAAYAIVSVTVFFTSYCWAYSVLLLYPFYDLNSHLGARYEQISIAVNILRAILRARSEAHNQREWWQRSERSLPNFNPNEPHAWEDDFTRKSVKQLNQMIFDEIKALVNETKYQVDLQIDCIVDRYESMVGITRQSDVGNDGGTIQRRKRPGRDITRQRSTSTDRQIESIAMKNKLKSNDSNVSLGSAGPMDGMHGMHGMHGMNGSNGIKRPGLNGATVSSIADYNTIKDEQEPLQSDTSVTMSPGRGSITSPMRTLAELPYGRTESVDDEKEPPSRIGVSHHYDQHDTRREPTGVDVKKHVQNEIKKRRSARGACAFLKEFCSVLYSLKMLIFVVVSHIFDTATDIGLAVQWGVLWANDTYPKKVDMLALFLASVGVILYYRACSAYHVFKLTRSRKDAIFQFLFDFFILKLLNINLTEMKSRTPMETINIMRGIEGSHESAYQAILALVFLIQTDFEEISGDSFIAIISLVFSTISLISRFTTLDTNYLLPRAATYGNCPWYRIYYLCYRGTEIVFSILLYALLWTQAGPEYCVLVLILCLIVPYLNYKTKGYLSTEFLKEFLIVNFSQGKLVSGRKRHRLGYGKYPCCRLMYLFFAASWLFLFRTGCVALIVVATFWVNTSIFADTWEESAQATQFSVWLTMSLFIWQALNYPVILQWIVDDEAFIIADEESSLYFNPLSFIARGKTKEILFCKYMKINIFTNEYNKKSQDAGSILRTVAVNMLEAIIMSDDINVYYVVKSWYDSTANLYKSRGEDTFDDYLRKFGWYPLRHMYQLRRFCEGPDMYELVQGLGGLDWTQFKDDSHHNNKLYHMMSYRTKPRVLKWLWETKIVTDENKNETAEYNQSALHLAILGILNLGRKSFEECTERERKTVKILARREIDESIKATKFSDEQGGQTAKQYAIAKLGDAGAKMYDDLIGQ